MKNINWKSILAAYQNGLTADMVQVEFECEQGVIWTVPPCSPEALERAGRQFLRSRARRILHFRRAILRRRDRTAQDVIVATELPTRCQNVRDLSTAEEVLLSGFLHDSALDALEAAFAPSAAGIG